MPSSARLMVHGHGDVEVDLLAAYLTDLSPRSPFALELHPFCVAHLLKSTTWHGAAYGGH